MAIQKFTWSNGTVDSPITLTENQMDTLIKAGQNLSIDAQVSGVYTTPDAGDGTHPLKSYLYYVLEDLYEGKLVKADEVTLVEDVVRLSVGGVATMDEGTHTAITATGQVPLTYLHFDYTIVQSNGTVPANLLNRIRVVPNLGDTTGRTGNIVVDAPTENTTWDATIRIVAYPSYLESDPGEGDNRAVVMMGINAVRLNGITINGETNIKSGTQTYYKIVGTNADNTKLAYASQGMSITPATNPVSIIDEYARGNYGTLTKEGDSWLFNATMPGTSTFAGNVYLGGTAIVEETTKTVVCTQGVLNSTIRIDQRNNAVGLLTLIDEAVTHPNHFDNIAINSDGTVKSPDVNAFSWVRANSHIFVGHVIPNTLDDTEDMYLRQVSDSDKRYWNDGGTQVTFDGWVSHYNGGSNGAAIGTLDLGYDYWMKLPVFWYKIEPFTNNQGVTVDNVYNFTIATEDPSLGDLEGDWLKWDGLTLIGVYEGYVANNQLYSAPNQNVSARSACTVIDSRYPEQEPTIYSGYQKNIQEFKSYARSRSRYNTFHLISEEAHSMMALLGYSYYGVTDIQSVCGRGTPTHWSVSGTTYYFPRITGLSDAKGMADTTKAEVDAWENDIVDLVNDAVRVPDLDGYIDIANDISTNFWGIENWWGNTNEFVDNILTLDSSRTLGIFNLGVHFLSNGQAQVSPTDSTTVQPIHTVTGSTASGACITRMAYFDTNDDYAGMLPKTVVSDGNYASGYCGYGYVHTAASLVAYRSSISALLYGGLGYLDVHYYLGNASPAIGSRLLYRATGKDHLKVVTSL